MAIHITPLGAGQEVGRSCILVSINDKTIMLDCGINANSSGADRYPNFSRVANSSNQLTQKIDLLLVTHFHIDHIGALPIFTEQLGYTGPIYMTNPTKALFPIMLEESIKFQGGNYKNRKIKKKDPFSYHFSKNDITKCMKKITGFDLKQTVVLNGGLEFTAYYAGHVLGAAMFYIKYKEHSIVYTGDYNMTPDFHLESASIPHLQPDVLITESTYGDVIKSSNSIRNLNFLNKIHERIDKGGKVLIASSSLTHSQEMASHLDRYLESNNINCTIYCDGQLNTKSYKFLGTFSNWTSQLETEKDNENFKFKNVKNFDDSLFPKLKLNEPIVIFASPSNLNFGNSLSILKNISEDSNNLLLIPGYCEQNSNAFVIKNIIKENRTRIVVPNQVSKSIRRHMNLNLQLSIDIYSFSNHTDLKGIMQLVEGLKPKNVILVHGDTDKVLKLKERVKKDLTLPCYSPENMEHIKISIDSFIPVKISNSLLQSSIEKYAST
ncbi:Metallo-hydrolase/oxidoreductase, partial [Conidiobolus coronatus NRRL 28638]